MDIVLLTVDEAAKRLGVHPKTIRRRIRAGTLPANKVDTPRGFEWRVPVSAVPEPEDGGGSLELAKVDVFMDALTSQLESVSVNVSTALGSVQDTVHADAEAILGELRAIREELQRAREDRERRPAPWWRRILGRGESQ